MITASSAASKYASYPSVCPSHTAATPPRSSCAQPSNVADAVQVAYVRPSPLAGFRMGLRDANVNGADLLGKEPDLRPDLDHHELWKPDKEVRSGLQSNTKLCGPSLHVTVAPL